jgi:hypothetical protein
LISPIAVTSNFVHSSTVIVLVSVYKKYLVFAAKRRLVTSCNQPQNIDGLTLILRRHVQPQLREKVP